MGVLFLDTETTGLDPRTAVPWEVAIIEPDGTEYVWCWRPRDHDMRRANPKALDVGGFRERAPLTHLHSQEAAAAADIADLVEGNVVVGSNPHFDVSILTPWLRWHCFEWNAHYRPVCAVTMAAGWIAGAGARASDEANMRGEAPPDLDLDRLNPPWRSYAISEACGIAPPSEHERHTALGDARWVKRLYERITGAA